VFLYVVVNIIRKWREAGERDETRTRAKGWVTDADRSMQ
jgi:hypothetical protein